MTSEELATAARLRWGLVIAVAFLAGFALSRAAFALPGPEDTQAQAGCQSIVVSWSPISGATGYRVHRFVTSGLAPPDTTITSPPLFDLAPPGVSRSYRVASLDNGGNPGPLGNKTDAALPFFQPAPAGLDIGPSREALVGNPLFLNLIAGTWDSTATITWRKNGVPTGWPSQSGHVTPNPQLSDAGDYDCIVCNVCGCDTSGVAHVAMYATSQPTSVTAAVACTTITVTWPPVSGATGYLVTNHTFDGPPYVLVTGPPYVETSHVLSAQYSVRTVVRDSLYAYDPAMGRMSNLVGTDMPPQIDLDPVGASLEEGEPLNLFVRSGTNGGSTTFTRRKNGVTVASGSSTSYTVYHVPATTLADAGTYDVVISNTCGTVTSAPAVVTVCRTPIVDIPPWARDLHPSLDLPSISIGGTVQRADSIRWFRTGVLLADNSHFSGTTAGTMVIHGQSSADNGYYQLKAYGSCQIIEGPVIRLTVNDCLTAPAFTSQPPATASATLGHPVTISVSVSGCGPFQYQWFKHDNRWGNSNYSDPTWDPVYGANQPSLTVNVDLNTSGDYRCRVTYGWYSIFSTICNIGVAPDFHFTYLNAVANCGEIDVSWNANEPAHVTPYVWSTGCGVGAPRILGTSSLATSGQFVILDPNGIDRALSLSATGSDNSLIQSACVPISGSSFGSHVYAGITVLPYYQQTANGQTVPILVSVGNDGCSVFGGTISLTGFSVDNVPASLLDSNLAPVLPASLVPASMNAGMSRQFPTYLLPVTPPGPNVIQQRQLFITITITPSGGTATTLTAMARLNLTSAGPN